MIDAPCPELATIFCARNDITELGSPWSGHYLDAGDEISDDGGDTIPEIHASRDDGSSINTRICHDSSH